MPNSPISEHIKDRIKTALRVPYYRQLWGDSVLTFNNLPLSNRHLFDAETISDSYAVNEKEISYCFFSSGTVSTPRMIPFTAQEWKNRAAYRAACYAQCGVRKTDKAAILLPFGPWIAGPSAQSALIELGCTSFPIGLLANEAEIEGFISIIEKHSINVLITTPSFLESFLDILEKNKKNLKLRLIITSGEYLHGELKKRAREVCYAETFSAYGSSESFIGIECRCSNGFHFDPQLILVETIDKKTNKPTKAGGRIVITNPLAEAVPLIRYELEDLGKISYSKCACGSNLPRIIWQGRESKNFVVAGAVNVYPYQIYEALAKSKFSISRCEIELLDHQSGQDLVIFNFFFKDPPEDTTQAFNELQEIINNLSIDFNDVSVSKLVSTVINIKPNTKLKYYFKKEKLYIYDKRSYIR